jgi:predicted RNA-binding protein with PUA-like domain
MALVRIGRLSVQPVTEKEYAVIMELAGEKK